MSFVKRLLILLLLLPQLGKAQVITTVAGSGTIAYCGDGGQATGACLNHPYDIALDSKGNIYFSEQNNNVVRKIDHAGVITTVAGMGISGYSGDGGPANTAQLFYPLGIAFDRTDNLFISDYGNNCIRKVDTFGIITTVAGTGIAGYNGDSIAATNALLNVPTDVVVDSIGNIYISDGYNFRIRKIDTAGIISTIAGIGTLGYSADGVAASAAQIFPIALTLANDNLYFSDSDVCIRVISNTGIISTVAGTRTAGFSGDGLPATVAKLDLSGGAFEVEPNGVMLIADCGNDRIRKVDNLHKISTIAGTGVGGYSGDGGDPLLAKFTFPSCAVTDSSGHIYIADIVNGRIRCIGCDSRLSVTYIDQSQGATLSINPNPVFDGKVSIFLASPETTETDLTITDMVGRRLLQIPITTNASTDIELKLSKGLYFISGTIQNTTLTQKIVIQ